MKTLITLNRLFLTCILLPIHLSLYPQAIDWKDHPDETFVFEIDEKDAEALLLSDPNEALVVNMLHTPVASFTKEWRDIPDKGHFIYAKINKNKVFYQYVPIIPFQVFLFKEYGVFSLQIVDKEGKVLSNAKVRIKGKWRLWDTAVSFDKESQTYRINDTSENTKRLLTIEAEGFKMFLDLNKHLVNPWYGGYNDSPYTPDFYSYMVTDKNKYKPGQLVRFKSYVLSNRKKPLKEELSIWIQGNNYKYKDLGTLSPYNPGGYAGDIQLHDSLDLELDRYYPIQLRDKKNRIVANASFKYEDYELYESRMEVKLSRYFHYYPEDNQIEIKVTDANNLLLQDVKADITVKRKSVNHSYADVLVLPDILLSERINLKNDEPTTYTIPASIFKEADGSYEVEVIVLTPDNQRREWRKTVNYFYSHYDLSYYTTNDTVHFLFNELGKNKPAKAMLFYDEAKKGKEIWLPHNEPFNQGHRSYLIKLADYPVEKRFYTAHFNSGLGLTGGIIADSFNVKLVNPLALELSWFLYQGNDLLEKGSGKEFDFKYPNTDLEVAHYVEIFYFMGDEEKVFRQVFVPKSEYLSVDVDLPERIYPGQKVDGTITVKDHLGEPVKDADLTAFATNSQLNYHVPDLPYYGSSPRMREQRSSYSINEKNYAYSTQLDYKFWNKHAKLDEMEYYRFTYPWNKTFIHTVNTPDSVTQFAPFVMKDGNAVDIYVIEVNGTPVYFSWTEQPRGYSFLASDTNKQQISIRLHDRALIFDSIRFEQGKKTIISVDLDHLPGNVRTVKLPNYRFNEHEANNYKKYIARFPVVWGIPASLIIDTTEYWVSHPLLLAEYKSNTLIGPIPQGKARFMNGVEYKQEGGFSYQFDGNVVYKYDVPVLPSNLRFTSSDQFNRLNQFYFSQKVIDQIITDYRNEHDIWRPEYIQISRNNIDMLFHLPEDKEKAGVANILFMDRKDKNIYLPDKLFERENALNIPEGIYDVILLYNNGKYLLQEKVPIKTQTYTEVKLNDLQIQEPDSSSQEWLKIKSYSWKDDNKYKYYSTEVKDIRYREFRGNKESGNIVMGRVYDEMNEPLIGVSVHLKGTDIGTITDIDGQFSLDIGQHSGTLVFNYIGLKSKEVNVYAFTNLTVPMESDELSLDEVVVVAYGVHKQTSLTGSVSSDSGDTGQSPPEKLDDTEKDESEILDAEDRLYNELMQLNGLRSNFSDVGFWEPRLFTDKKGKAAFSVTFPDNITRWDAVVYAMNRKLKTGTTRKYIRSYKPLMAELKTPQFLVAGDSAYFSGYLRNYTQSNEITGNLLFINQEDTLAHKKIGFTSSYQEHLLVKATDTDSITSTYLFTRDDGYEDGEKRSIPVAPLGTEIAGGSLQIMRNGDQVSVLAEPGEEVHIKITGKQFDIYMDATYYLTGYKYACNEQLASKLIGLLNYKVYQQYLNEPFNYDKNINEIIKRLLKNQNDKKLWSWWERSSETSYWMSAHILRALKLAKDAGYTVDLNIKQIENNYLDLRSYRAMRLDDIDLLHTLSDWGTEQQYAPAVQFFEQEIHRLESIEDSLSQKYTTCEKRSYLKEKLQLWEIRQKQQSGYVSDSIRHYLKEDVFGAVYCDDGLRRPWYNDVLATTLIAYRIIRNDSALQDIKEPMQMYILNTKRFGWNTYQASSAIMTVLPDLFNESYNKENPATILLSGKEDKLLNEFPYETVLKAGEHLSVKKKDGMPLIYSAYSLKRVTGERIGEAFEVSTNFSEADTLVAGKPVTLKVYLQVKQKNAEHVMIEVPIPAGCSYESKDRSYSRYETHREHFKEKAVIFCEALPEGIYSFELKLLPRYSGKYHLNPAKAEMMYFPVINANNELRKITINQHE